MSGSYSPQTTDPQTTSANTSCKLQQERTTMVLFTASAEYTSVRLILTGIPCQERVTCYAPRSVL